MKKSNYNKSGATSESKTKPLPSTADGFFAYKGGWCVRLVTLTHTRAHFVCVVGVILEERLSAVCLSVWVVGSFFPRN